MNNNIIYTPYVYHICWSKTNMHYIGVEYKQTAHPDNLWSKYYTSSKKVKAYREENGEPDIIEVRKTFNNLVECREYEYKLLTKINASISDNFLNKSNGELNFTKLGGTDRVPVKDRDGNTFSIYKNDPRYLSGELVHVINGRLIVKDKHGNTF